MSEQAIIDQLVVITDALADLHVAVGQLRQEQTAIAQAIAEQLVATGEQRDALAGLAEGQAEGSRRLEQIAAVIGMIYLSTNSKTAIPADVWNDPVFDRFLDMYPIDGPPIVGARVMRQLLDQMEQQEPAQLAAAFSAVEQTAALTKVERVRNAQLAEHAYERIGELGQNEPSERPLER